MIGYWTSISNKVRLFAELRRAFFEKCPHAFFGFLSLVIQADRLYPELADAPDGLRVGIDGTLGNGQRSWTLFENLPTPLLNFGVELLVGYDAIA